MGAASSFSPDPGSTSASGRLTDFADRLGRAALRHIRLVGPIVYLGLVLAVAIIAVLAGSALVDWPMHAHSMTPVTVLTIALGGMLCVCAWGIGKSIAKQKLQLDTALNNMQQGLLLFDATGRLVLYNQHFLQMYRLSAGAVKLGCTLSDLLRLRKAAGTFQG